VNVPLGLLLLGLTGVGPLIAWRKASTANLRRQFIGPVAAGGTTLVLLLAAGMRDFYALVALALAGFVAGTIGQEFYRGIRARRRMHGESAALAFGRLIGRNRRRYGGYIVHAGILIYFVAFAGMAFRRQQEATLKPGESVEMRSPFGHTYRFTHLGISQYEALNRVVSAATVEVTKDGRRNGLMTSEKRQHVDSFNRPTFEPSTEVAIRSNLQEDVYMVFAGAVNGTEEAVYRFNLNPLVWWVWFGGLVLVLGGLITMWPGGGPVVAAPRRKQAGYQVELVGTGTN
jgi:cytochrome c-type biogenesis protein CcmF